MTPVKEAVTVRPFPQLPFMSEQAFASFLKDRGIDIGVAGVRSFVESGLIEKLEAESGDYHPFQIWPINKLLQGLRLRLETGISLAGMDPESLKKFIDQNWTNLERHLIDFPRSNACLEFNQQLLPLLLWLESYFLPITRGPRPGVVSFVGQADSRDWEAWRKSTEVKDWLETHSISIKQLSAWRTGTLLDAYIDDPASSLYLLLRSMPFGQRKQFKGQLRLVYDLYEITEITRLFLEHTPEQPVVKEWDPNGRPDTLWVERIYGGQPKFGAPEFLRRVLRDFGLDPGFRILWLVEGDTEDGFILRYTERLKANIGEFVTIRNFGGDGSFQKQIPAIDADLQAAREEQCFVTLTFDDDSNSTRRRLEGLVEKGLVNVRFVLNKPDFELGNFTVGQLVSVAATWASGLSKPIKLNQETLAEEVSLRIKEKNEGFQKAFNSVLHVNGENQFKLSKGAEWGKRLADYLIETRNSTETRNSELEAGTYLEHTPSKIERQLLFIIRSSQPSIDYPGSIRNLDPASLEIT